MWNNTAWFHSIYVQERETGEGQWTGADTLMLLTHWIVFYPLIYVLEGSEELFSTVYLKYVTKSSWRFSQISLGKLFPEEFKTVPL